MDRPYVEKRPALAAGPRWRPLVGLGELGALAALLLVCAALFAAAGAWARPLAPVAAGRLDPGPAFYAGLNGSERHADGYSYMWTTGSALVQLRGAYNAAPAYVAELRLRGGNPAGPQPLTILAGGRPVATVTPAERFRTYRLLLDASAAAEGGELWLGLQTAPFTPPGDARELGVLLTDIVLTPVPGPQLPRAAAVALGLAALWTLLRGLGSPWRDALALVGLAGLGLAALTALERPPLVPLPWLAPLLLAGVAGAALVARPLAARLGLAALATLVALSGLLWPAWLSDDAFISFRYAQNLAQGHGLVYNVGERVEGYTNFLWTVLAALVIALGGDVAVWSHLAGAALGVAIVLLTYRLGARLAGAPWGLLAALIVGTSQSLLLYTGRGSGLETGLFTLLVLAGSERYLAYHLATAEQGSAPVLRPRSPAGLGAAGRPRWAALTPDTVSTGDHAGSPGPGAASPQPGSDALPGPTRPHSSSFILQPLLLAGLLLALAALTRPEGAMVFALTAAHLALRASAGGDLRAWAGRLVGLALRPSPLWLLAGAFLAVYLPYFAWRLWYYGDLLPNTFYAKTGGGLSQVLRGAAYAGSFALTLGGPLLLVALAPWARGWRAALASWRGYLLPLTLAYSAYIVAVGGDHFRGERFFVPLLPWIAILMADGAAAIFAAVATRAPRALAPAGALALGLALAVGAVAALGRTRPIDPVIQGLDESVWIWRDIGWWMADHTPPEASLAAAGAGAVAFYGQRETIDLYGLTDKHIGRLEVEGMGTGVAGHEKRDPVYVLEVRRPSYIPRIWEEYFGGEDALLGRYEPVGATTRTGRPLELWQRRP
ncbi:MAG TPA: hypothetical protein PKD53_24695 [Chloroflexaceae bacterium]|nr:hypothetical protein [Chloroflexaceae bacterium]